MENGNPEEPEFIGEYYLEGVHEMASGFLLMPDQSFQFFFSYGALDRYGSGNWTEKDGLLTLTGKPWPGSDFAILKSDKTDNGEVSIRIVENNPFFLQYVYASLQEGREESWEVLSKQGEISFAAQPFEHISLIFEFCAERFSKMEVDKSHNNFEFRFEPWLMEVFFQGFQLKIEEGILRGMHPLLIDKEHVFRKSQG